MEHAGTISRDLTWIESDRERNHLAAGHAAMSSARCAECDVWEGAWVDRMAADLAADLAAVSPGDPSEYTAGAEKLTEHEIAVAVSLPSLSDFLAAVRPIRSLDAFGAERWHEDGKLHRLDGPAVTHPDGTTEWWVNGRRHRSDGPAVASPDGAERWYRNGQLHRTDGPAVKHPDGVTEWWANGVRLPDPPLSFVA